MTDTENSRETAEEENRLIAERRSKLQQLREAGPAFPNDFRRDALAAELQQELGGFEKAELEEKDRKAAVAGRIMAKRGPFLVLQDASGRIQLYAD